MNTFLGIFILFISISFPFFCTADDFGPQDLRCEENLISVGAGKQEVLASCGKPASQEPGVPEIWMYNFGPTDFVYTLIFDEDGKLQQIRQGARGY